MVIKPPKRLNHMSTENSAIFIIMVIILMTVEKLGIDTLKTLRSRLILHSGRVQHHFWVQWKSHPYQGQLGLSTGVAEVKHMGRAGDIKEGLRAYVLNYRLDKSHPDHQNSWITEWASIESTRWCRRGLLRQTSIRGLPRGTFPRCVAMVSDTLS